ANALIVREEEQLVPDHGSADGAAELVLIERIFRPAPILEVVARIESRVAVVEIAGAAERVRARLRHGDENAAARLAVLRRHAVGFDLEFLDRIHRWIERLTAEDRRRDGGSVEDVVLVSRAVSVDAQIAVVATAVARGLL